MNKHHLLALDIGGTKTQCSLYKVASKDVPTNQLQELSSKRIPTLRDNGYPDTLRRISGVIKEVLSQNNLSPNELMAIGAGMPGSVNPQTQIMVNGNSKIFINQNFPKDLQNALDTNAPVFCTNDANCFALAETFHGAGKLYEKEFNVKIKNQTAVGIILGTGCGGGAVINGRVLTGSLGGGCELGHTKLHDEELECYCGQTGCAELYLSGKALERSHGGNLSAKEIFESSEQSCQDSVNKYKKDLVKFLTNLERIFNPHYFVFGGGVSHQGDIFKDIEEQVQSNSFVPSAAPKLYQHQISDSAGVLGAAMYAIENMEAI